MSFNEIININPFIVLMSVLAVYVLVVEGLSIRFTRENRKEDLISLSRTGRWLYAIAFSLITALYTHYNNYHPYGLSEAMDSNWTRIMSQVSLTENGWIIALIVSFFSFAAMTIDTSNRFHF